MNGPTTSGTPSQNKSRQQNSNDQSAAGDSKNDVMLQVITANEM